MIARHESIPSTSQYVAWLMDWFKVISKNVVENLSVAKVAQKVESDKWYKSLYKTGLSGIQVWSEQGQPSVQTHNRYCAVPFYITKIVHRPPRLETPGDQSASVGEAPIAAGAF